MPKQALAAVMLFAAAVLIAPSSWAWTGKVVEVADGDTVEVLRGRKAKRIRLYGVDTPELHQDYGMRAKWFTTRMVLGKVVEVDPVDTDEYGRIVAMVSAGDKRVNEELVRAGLAWVYRSYCHRPECSGWLRLEDEARSAKRALWSAPHPVPPWEFRHGEADRRPTVADWLRHYLRGR